MSNITDTLPAPPNDLPTIMTEQQVDEWIRITKGEVKHFQNFDESLWNLRDMFSKGKSTGILYSICKENDKILYHKGLYFAGQLEWAVFHRP
jgi:hypothetical protein